MTVFFADPDATLHHGDALQVLRELAAESVHAAVTSPPFYGLRDYGVDGQIGLEETPAEWCASLVAVFDELRRVLRSDGVLWVEMGDSYGSAGHGGKEFGDGVDRGRALKGQEWAKRIPEWNVKQKDLLLQPFMLAQALRDDGWYLRGCYPWVRPNGMPESAKDRFTVCTSYVFQLTKSARYFFDGDAVTEPAQWRRWGTQDAGKYAGQPSKAAAMQARTKEEILEAFGGQRWPRGVFTNPTEPSGLAICEPCGAYWDHCSPVEHCGQPVVQHYAAFPRALVRRCLLASTPKHDRSVTILDPFAGSGTSLLVARELGLHSIGIELREAYCRMIERRLGQLSLLA